MTYLLLLSPFNSWVNSLSLHSVGEMFGFTYPTFFNFWVNWLEMPVLLQIISWSSWWNSWGVYIAFAAILIISGHMFYKNLLQRKLAEQEALRLKELDRMKSELYANVTHEFRTPLMLILGQIDQCMKEFDGRRNPEQIKKLTSMKNNSHRLLQLVNQILDLRKLEGGDMTFNWKHGDIIMLLGFIADSFQSMAQTQKIRLVFESKIPSLDMDYDSDKIFKITTNLLSNALKFTPSGGKIVFFVQVTDDQLEFQVKDSGSGISPEDLPHVFNRFYQSKSKFNTSGTGIGLTLVKELVELLEGSISVQSVLHVGTSFTVRLPIQNKYEQSLPPQPNRHNQDFLEELDALLPAAKTHQHPNDYEENLAYINGKKPLLLLVEDNPEVARFIGSLLQEQYYVKFEKDGEAGILRAIELIPDLIISDVMMPLKSGFDLLSMLKNDIRTSHIPIILLTARAEAESKLEGLRRGADAYLAKPFQEDELLLQVQRLLTLRKILQKRYAMMSIPDKQSTSSLTSHVIEEFDLPTEDRFLKEVMDEIKSNISDPDFGPSKLCQSLAMSSSQLHRKLTAITDKTPVQLIRYVRLSQAKVLLRQPGLSISDVAYDSGFKDPAYFSRIFSKQYGVSPSEFKEYQV